MGNGGLGSDGESSFSDNADVEEEEGVDEEQVPNELIVVYLYIKLFLVSVQLN